MSVNAMDSYVWEKILLFDLVWSDGCGFSMPHAKTIFHMFLLHNFYLAFSMTEKQKVSCVSIWALQKQGIPSVSSLGCLPLLD